MPDALISDDYRIKEAHAISGTHEVKLVWFSGEETTADFSRYVGSGVFTKFADFNFFKLVDVASDGHVLTWPGGLDFSADDLWYEAHPQDIPKNHRPYYPGSIFRGLNLK